MFTKQLMLACWAAVVLGIGVAQAGPCNTGNGKTAQDAGAGPTVGNTGQTTGTGSTNAGGGPPASKLIGASGDSTSWRSYRATVPPSHRLRFGGRRRTSVSLRADDDRVIDDHGPRATASAIPSLRWQLFGG